MSAIEPPKGATPEYMAWVEKHTGRSLPVVIDGPGLYRARNGKTARITDHDRKASSSFKCEGYLTLREKPKRQEWSIWKNNGQYAAIGEHPKDIVEKIQ